jgi:hypothetical protein
MGRWQVNAFQAIATLPRDAARMLAVEILLAEPESLGDDVLESCLYLLRERLRADASWTPEPPGCRQGICVRHSVSCTRCDQTEVRLSLSHQHAIWRVAAVLEHPGDPQPPIQTSYEHADAVVVSTENTLT